MTYYRDDDEYDRAYRDQVRAIPVVEPCSYCVKGEVAVGDALALCGMCGGSGRQVTERELP